MVLAPAGVAAIAAASQAAEPSTDKVKTLTFEVVFSPFTPIAANNQRDPNSPSPSATRSSSTTSCSPAASGSATTSAPA
jgi:hypothetical protein